MSNKSQEIIAHLPITDNMMDNDKKTDKTDIDETSVNNIFYKNDLELEIELLNKEIDILKKKLSKKKNKKSNGLKCWWCTYDIENETINLPDKYYNDVFYCFGNFCSFNCAKSFNNNLNDEKVSKRNSLLNYKYKLTCKKCIEIKPAPSWKVLTDYGGILDINEFRKNFVDKIIDYHYLKPPIITFNSQINIDNKMETKKNTFTLKRSKPINTSKYSLKTSMGLKIIKT